MSDLIARALANRIQPVPGSISNLYNSATVNAGQYVVWDTGGLLSNASYNATDYIQVKQGVAYTANYRQQIAFYDKNKNYISGVNALVPYNTTWTFYAPDLAAYVRMTFLSGMNFVLNEDTQLNGMYHLANDVSGIAIRQPVSSLIGYKKVQSRNLFDPASGTPGYYVAYNNGAILQNANYMASGFITVLPGHPYTINYAHQTAWYDSNNNYISGFNPSTPYTQNTIYAPSNAAYVRCTVGNPYINLFQIEQSTYATDYQPFYLFTLDGLSTDFIRKKLSGKNDIILPQNVYAMLGSTSPTEEMNIYFKNILNGRYDPYTLKVSSNYGRQFQEYYRVQPGNTNDSLNPTAVGTFPVNISVNDYMNNPYATATTTVNVVSKTATSAITVMCIGDSMTVPVQTGTTKYVEQVSTTLSQITMVGTRTLRDGAVCSEGRGGWTASQYTSQVGDTVQDSPFMFPTGITNGAQYRGNTEFWKGVVTNTSAYDWNGFQKAAAGWSAATGGTSPNYTYNYVFNSNGYPTSPTTNDIVYDPLQPSGQQFQQWNGTAWAAMATQPTWQFSFQRYMERWSAAIPSAPSIVTILLGANDFQKTNGIASGWKGYLSSLQTMISSIQAYNSNIKIVICMPVIGTPQDGWALNTGTSGYSDQYRRNVQDLNRAILTQWDNAASVASKIYIAPMLLGLDSVNGFDTQTMNANKYSTNQIAQYSNWVHPNTSGYQQMGDMLAALIQAIR